MKAWRDLKKSNLKKIEVLQAQFKTSALLPQFILFICNYFINCSCYSILVEHYE